MPSNESDIIVNANLKNNLTVALLEQSLLHWRHIENLRQGFTTVWSAIIAGVLAFVSQTPDFLNNPATVPALSFLVILTVLGLLMSLRLSYNIKPCEESINSILQTTELERYNLIKGWQKGVTRHFRLRRIYSLTYFIALIFLISLLMLNVLSSTHGIEISIKFT
jgi:hypothetical protein